MHFVRPIGPFSIFVDVATESECGLDGFNQIVNGLASVFSIPCELGSKAWFMSHENINRAGMGFERINLTLAKVAQYFLALTIFWYRLLKPFGAKIASQKSDLNALNLHHSAIEHVIQIGHEGLTI
jgi:hypothetical protein